MAENDALVELIQTAEYLEDIPTWGQRDYQLYPFRYGNPFYRGRGRGRGRGRREMISERPPERDSTQGFGRGLTQEFLEGKMVKDSIPKGLWKEMKDTAKQRNGQILLVREKGGVMPPSTPLQPTVNIQGSLPLLPHQKIDPSQIGAVLGQDLHWKYHHPKMFL